MNDMICREMGLAEEIAMLDIDEETKRRLINKATRLEERNEEIAKKYDDLWRKMRNIEMDKDIYRNALTLLCSDFVKERTR